MAAGGCIGRRPRIFGFTHAHTAKAPWAAQTMALAPAATLEAEQYAAAAVEPHLGRLHNLAKGSHKGRGAAVKTEDCCRRNARR